MTPADSNLHPTNSPLTSHAEQPPKAAGWGHLSARLGQAMCAMRAINDLRHSTDIIFPGHRSQGTGRAAAKLQRHEQLVRLPADDGKSQSVRNPTQQVMLWWAPARNPNGDLHADARSRPTMLLFYGAEQNLSSTLAVARKLCDAGFNLAVAEYIGYGLSSGSPSERGCHATAQAALNYLLSRDDIDPTRLVLGGCGLGSAVATELASKHDVAALVCISGFGSMANLLRWRLPSRTVDALVRQRFDAATAMKQVRCPVAIISAADDPIVAAHLSEQLALATRSACRRIAIGGCMAHGIDLLAEREVLASVIDFVETARPRKLSAGVSLNPIVATRPTTRQSIGETADVPSPMRLVPTLHSRPTVRAG